MEKTICVIGIIVLANYGLYKNAVHTRVRRIPMNSCPEGSRSILGSASKLLLNCIGFHHEVIHIVSRLMTHKSFTVLNIPGRGMNLVSKLEIPGRIFRYLLKG